MATRIPAEERIGQTFGLLTIMAIDGHDRQGRAYAMASCACGGRRRALLCNIMDRRSSCGCAAVAHRQASGRARRRGPEYRCWLGMKERCTNTAFKNYGGRGISVCQRWADSFEVFISDMGPRPSPKHSIDRIDNDGNYEPGNCRWATNLEQARNRRTNRVITLDGESLCLVDWAKRTGVDHRTISERLRKGWDERRAVLTPARPHVPYNWRAA